MEHLYLDAASTEPVGGNVISVMMPLTSAVAISEQPFVTALPSVWGRQTGLTKWSRLFRLENTSRPTMAVMVRMT